MMFGHLDPCPGHPICVVEHGLKAYKPLALLSPVVPTRYLLILSAIAAVAILIAGAIWLLGLLA